MSVNADRVGSTVTVTVVIDVTDILAQAGLTLQQKRQQGLARAVNELARAGRAMIQADATLDADATAYSAEIAAVKAARPTGSF